MHEWLQATPLVSGIIAAYLADNLKATPDKVKKKIQKAAARNLLDNLSSPYDGTVNYFVQARAAVI